jgi:uncharacterized protein
MGLRPHYLFDVLIGSICLLTLAAYWYGTRRFSASRVRLLARLILLSAALVVIAGVAVSPIRIGRHVPNEIVVWVKCIALFLSAWVIYSIPVAATLWKARPHHPGRRRLLQSAAVAAMAAPPVLAAAAFIQRENLTFREVDVFLPGLPPGLQGLRIVQLSDIHLSPFVSEALLARAIGMANDTRAHIALVTGDLVSRVGDPLDACLRHLSRLRADAGIFGCMGNHEIYASAEDYTTLEGARLGMRFLRGESQRLYFGDALLNLAGVDYQRRERKYLSGAESLVIPGATNVLLSHNPDVFPVAASQGFDLTLSGHTHGGQVNFEILERGVNIARFYTPYVYGRYERGGKSLFVTRGVGTVGAPARFGAPPEVALVRLCAS